MSHFTCKCGHVALQHNPETGYCTACFCKEYRRDQYDVAPRPPRQAEFYDYHVRYSSEDGCFVASVTEWPSLKTHGDSMDEALSELVTVVLECLDDMAESGETPPKPLHG